MPVLLYTMLNINIWQLWLEPETHIAIDKKLRNTQLGLLLLLHTFTLFIGSQLLENLSRKTDIAKLSHSCWVWMSRKAGRRDVWAFPSSWNRRRVPMGFRYRWPSRCLRLESVRWPSIMFYVIGFMPIVVCDRLENDDENVSSTWKFKSL